MLKWTCLALVSALVLTFTTGCVVDPEDARLGAASLALEIDNAIVPNAIVPNAIVPNAIVPNAIVPNALDPGALDTASLAAITDPGQAGALSRMFIQYTVGCALSPTQSFSFSWTDAAGVVHQETYWGILGIVPSWATQPLTDGTRQQLVSGCLAGRTNYFGVHVELSMRSPQAPLKNTQASELAAYPNVEGAFWGNLFTSTPYLYSCFDTANVANSRAAMRDCATGYLDADGQVLPCGPITLAGPCETVCPNLGGGGKFYTSCTNPLDGTSTNVVITTALP
jgi:hypothetical protein